MVARVGQFQFFFNLKELEALVEKFGTTDKKELQKLMKKENLNTTTTQQDPNLTIKEQIAEANLKIKSAKADRIKEKESLQLRKLEAETELIEQHLNYGNTFGQSPPSEQANKTMKKRIENKYSPNYGHQNYNENIQTKKNFYINKLNAGEYCGCCKICQNFSTNICTTSREAEGDIEVHLEAVHDLELYAR